jgi:pentatricopeptide repeat protein
MCEEDSQMISLLFVFCWLVAMQVLVDEGMCCHVSMVTNYIIPAKLDHYTCMVDLLGHAGNLQEAENMVMAMSCKLDWLHRVAQHLQNSW